MNIRIDTSIDIFKLWKLRNATFLHFVPYFQDSLRQRQIQTLDSKSLLTYNIITLQKATSVKAYLKFQRGWYPINSKTCMNYGNKEIPFREQESIIKREIYIRNTIKGSPCSFHQTSKELFSNALRIYYNSKVAFMLWY